MVTPHLIPTGVGIYKVLVATDFSRFSDVALDFGLRVAKAYEADAYVVSVVPSDKFLLAGPEAYVAASNAARRDLLELKNELKRSRCYEEGKDYHLYLLDGNVAECILDFAEQKRIDLIVVGTHGRSGLGKALMGSVAEKVFRRSPVPVLTLGPCLRHSAQRTVPRNILVAVDFTSASDGGLRYAASLAREHHATLTAVHAVKRAEIEHEAGWEPALRAIEGKLEELLKRVAPGTKCDLRIEAGQVVPTILHTAAEMESDLLVVGVRASLGALDPVIWPHAYKIVRESLCPVLTVRESIEH